MSENDHIMIDSNFWYTDIIFFVIPVSRWLVTRLRHHISAAPVITDRIWCWKTVSVECLDRSRTLISELPQGTPEVNKWTLEDRIRARNTRVALGSYCRWAKSLGSTLNFKYWLTEIRQKSIWSWFKKTSNFLCIDVYF